MESNQCLLIHHPILCLIEVNFTASCAAKWQHRGILVVERMRSEYDGTKISILRGTSQNTTAAVSSYRHGLERQVVLPRAATRCRGQSISSIHILRRSRTRMSAPPIVICSRARTVWVRCYDGRGVTQQGAWRWTRWAQAKQCLRDEMQHVLTDR